MYNKEDIPSSIRKSGSYIIKEEFSGIMQRGDFVMATAISPVAQLVLGVLTEEKETDIVVVSDVGTFICRKDIIVVDDHFITDEMTIRLVNTLREAHSLAWYGTIDFPIISR